MQLRLFNLTKTQLCAIVVFIVIFGMSFARRAGNVASFSPLEPCGPQLIGLGTQKGGTTSLYGYLRSALPAVQVSPGLKELHFFDSDYNSYYRQHERVDVYLNYFNITKQRTLSSPDGSSQSFKATPCRAVDGIRYRFTNKVMAEVTPSYMLNPLIPERIKEIVPDARFIILLRNPVKRAVSAFAQKWRKNFINDTTTHINAWAENILVQSIEQVEKCFRKHPHLPRSKAVLECFGGDLRSHGSPLSTSYADIVWRGVYVDQLKFWFEVFPADRFMIWSSEEFGLYTKEHLYQLCDWLSIDRSALDVSKLDHRSNVGEYPDGFQVPEHVLDRLTEFYKPLNEELFEFLNQQGLNELSTTLQKYLD